MGLLQAARDHQGRPGVLDRQGERLPADAVAPARRPGLLASGRALLSRLHWRLRPARFASEICDTTALEAVVRPVETPAELASTGHEIAAATIAEASWKRLDPAFVLGGPCLEAMPDGPLPVPPVRLYRLQGETRIFGKGLFLRDGLLLTLPRLEFCELGRLDYPAHRLSLDAREDGCVTARRPQRLRIVREPCLYLAQCGESVWGHWLVDMFPRLVLGLSVPAGFKVVIDADTPPWAPALLGRAGVPPSRVIRHDKFRTTLVVRDLYLPSFPRYGDVFSPLVGLGWGLLPTSDEPASERLYVSRSRGAAGSTIVNAPEIEEAARRRGYRVVHPERFGLDAQARLFARATHVVGEFGSALHNTVFSRAGTRVGVLQSSASISYVQVGIGMERGQPTGIVYGDAVGGGRHFHLPPGLFAETLDRLDAPVPRS